MVRSLTISILMLFFSTSSQAIVNGKPLNPDDDLAKSTVLILFGQGNRCTGSILDSMTILTAAHCMIYGPDNYLVVFTTDLTPIMRGTEKAVIRKLETYKKHPEYGAKDRYSSDVAILKLKSPIPAGYGPAQLTEGATDFQAGTTLKPLGFGIKNARAIPYPSERISLDEVEVTTSQAPAASEGGIDLGYCRLYFNQPDRGICGGDSGGPVYFDGKIVAVNGAVVTGQLPCAAGAYVTRIDFALPWIKSEMLKSPRTPEQRSPTDN